jgi:hypothetical protein
MKLIIKIRCIDTDSTLTPLTLFFLIHICNIQMNMLFRNLSFGTNRILLSLIKFKVLVSSIFIQLNHLNRLGNKNFRID